MSTFVTFYCPGCGEPCRINRADDKYAGANKLRFTCPKCTTRWSVTFPEADNKLREHYILAKDY